MALEFCFFTTFWCTLQTLLAFRGDEQVFSFSWQGDLVDGEPVFSFEDQKLASELSEMIDRRRDLWKMRFRSSSGKSSLKGFEGFDGYVAGLRLAMAALGIAFVQSVGSNYPQYSLEEGVIL